METETKNVSLENAIEKALGTAEVLSPYRLAKVATTLVGREVIAQLTYAYCRQGLIVASKDGKGKIEVKRADALVWLNKYVPKHRIG